MVTDEPCEPAGQVPIGGWSAAEAGTIMVKPGIIAPPARPAPACSRLRRDTPLDLLSDIVTPPYWVDSSGLLEFFARFSEVVAPNRRGSLNLLARAANKARFPARECHAAQS